MKNKAQSISEYVILISIITLALMSMQLYFRRGIQAVIKYAADDFGNQRDAVEVDYQSLSEEDLNTDLNKDGFISNRAGRWIARANPIISETTVTGSEETRYLQNDMVHYDKEETSETIYGEGDGIVGGGIWFPEE